MNPFDQGLPVTIPLWTTEIPYADEACKSRPRLTVYLTSEEHRTGQAIIICPGGGYGFLSLPKEGHRVARFLSSHGHAAAVLEYRHAPYRHPVPLVDAQRAIRTMRHHAKVWHFNPSQIGILGFSAGGHLAGSTATKGQIDAALIRDAVDRQSSRPDFAVLVYPVISFAQACRHQGSLENLLGKEAAPELVNELSLENTVSTETPPILLIHTNEDDAVPAENSLLFYQALRAQGIPAEIHIYEKEGHGIGLAGNHPWGQAVLNWLKNRL